MSKKDTVPEPEKGLNFIDVHCHLPFPRPKNNSLPSDEDQYFDFFDKGGLFLITSSIDITTLNLILNFMREHGKNIGFTCGWAPQTVTYLPKTKYNKEWTEWIEYVLNNPKKYLAIGEIGLDFHHARTLEKRNEQVEELKKIFEKTVDLEKPYVLHVRNATDHERDLNNPNHRFNKKDGANQEILKILQVMDVNPKKVMWHCFSGPEEYGILLPKQGFTLSVPSSAYGFEIWRKMSKNAPIESLVSETDSYYQHPYQRGPVNVPSNVRYTIAALAYTHKISQDLVSKKTIANAIKFFDLKINRE